MGCVDGESGYSRTSSDGTQYFYNCSGQLEFVIYPDGSGAIAGLYSYVSSGGETLQVGDAPSYSYVIPVSSAPSLNNDVTVIETIAFKDVQDKITGWFSALTADTDNSGDADWVNPEAVFSSDNLHATVTLGANETSSFLNALNFGISLPDCAITDIEIIVEASVISGSVVSDEAIVYKLTQCNFS